MVICCQRGRICNLIVSWLLCLSRVKSWEGRKRSGPISEVIGDFAGVEFVLQSYLDCISGECDGC